MGRARHGWSDELRGREGGCDGGNWGGAVYYVLWLRLSGRKVGTCKSLWHVTESMNPLKKGLFVNLYGYDLLLMLILLQMVRFSKWMSTRRAQHVITRSGESLSALHYLKSGVTHMHGTVGLIFRRCKPSSTMDKTCDCDSDVGITPLMMPLSIAGGICCR